MCPDPEVWPGPVWGTGYGVRGMGYGVRGIRFTNNGAATYNVANRWASTEPLSHLYRIFIVPLFVVP